MALLGSLHPGNVSPWRLMPRHWGRAWTHVCQRGLGLSALWAKSGRWSSRLAKERGNGQKRSDHQQGNFQCIREFLLRQ
jgi:hypothetical protein